MHNDLKIVSKGFLRFFIYSLITFICLLIMLSVAYRDITTLGHIPDSSFTENLQETLLIISSMIFLYLNKKYHAKGLYLISGFLLCLFIREWDSVFDNIFHGAWKYIAIPAAILHVYLAVKDGYEKAIRDLSVFMSSRSYYIMILGMIIVLVVSRILGMRMVLTLIAGIHFQDVLKNFLEEGFELLGYMAIFIATVSYWREYSKLKSK